MTNLRVCSMIDANFCLHRFFAENGNAARFQCRQDSEGGEANFCHIAAERKHAVSPKGVSAGCLSKSRRFSASVRGKSRNKINSRKQNRILLFNHGKSRHLLWLFRRFQNSLSLAIARRLPRRWRHGIECDLAVKLLAQGRFPSASALNLSLAT